MRGQKIRTPRAHIPLSTVASFRDQSECNPYFGSFKILLFTYNRLFKIVQPPYATGTLFCNRFMQPLLQPMGVFVQPPYATSMQPATPERKSLIWAIFSEANPWCTKKQFFTCRCTPQPLQTQQVRFPHTLYVTTA